jgi:DNA repair protein RecO (recombination protein O)
MHLFTAEAIVLDVFDLHDRDRIVTFLTREQGKKRGVARGARTKHSRFAGQLQPLAKVTATWFEKEGQELARISAVELVRPADRLHADLDGILTGCYLADHAIEFAQENEASELLFRLLDSTTEALLSGVDRDLGARYFEAWVLRLAGIFPPPQACPACGDPLAGGAVLPSGGDALLCPRCGRGEGPGGMRVEPATVAFLRTIGRAPLAAWGAAAIPAVDAAVLRQVEALCAHVRRQFLQRELRSYDVIQRTRSAV